MRTEDTRDRAASARGAQAALAAAIAIATGSSAYGVAVRFDNPQGPGHFNWDDPGPLASDGENLDILLPAAAQPAASSQSTLLMQWSTAYPYSGLRSGAVEFESGSLLGYPMVASVESGVSIPSGNPWRASSAYIFSDYAGFASLLPEGVPTYLGVRFDLGAGWQYGWIGVTRVTVDGFGPHAFDLDPFAWGYETEPGVPIEAGAVPAPGSLALLAFGAAAGAARPRRKGC